jgi:hypothetical protein
MGGPRVFDHGVHRPVALGDVAHRQNGVVQVVEAVLAGGVVVEAAYGGWVSGWVVGLVDDEKGGGSFLR